MRIFQNKNWEYSVRQFELLEKKKNWSVRFRLEYALALNKGVSVRAFILNGLALLNLIRLSVKWSKKRNSLQGKKYLILVSRNEGYLRHLLPAAEAIVQKHGSDAIALCPAKEYYDLKSRLPASLSGILIPYESLADKDVIRRSAFSAITDLYWLMLQPVKKAFLLSTTFSRYAFTEHLLADYLRRNLTSEDVVIAANDHWMWESLVYLIAQEKGAQSYVLQHGMVEEISYPMFARKFLAWGEQSRKRMVDDFGAKPEEVAVTGSPYFDELCAKISTRSDESSNHEKPYITFLSQPFIADGYLPAADYESIVKRFYSLLPIAEKHGKKLLVKLHPREDGNVYGQKPGVVELTKEPLLDVLEKSCLTITVDSTAIFESVMSKVPSIQTIIPTAERQMIFAGTGICLLTVNEAELGETVGKLVGDATYYNDTVRQSQDALKLYFGEMSGALERIVALASS